MSLTTEEQTATFLRLNDELDYFQSRLAQAEMRNDQDSAQVYRANIKNTKQEILSYIPF